jgi:hypothetical protein
LLLDGTLVSFRFWYPRFFHVLEESVLTALVFATRVVST